MISLLQTVKALEESKPEPWFDEVRGKAVSLLLFRTVVAVHAERFVPVEGPSVFGSSLATGWPAIEDNNVPDGVVVLRGRNGRKHYLGVFDLRKSQLHWYVLDENTSGGCRWTTTKRNSGSSRTRAI